MNYLKYETNIINNLNKFNIKKIIIWGHKIHSSTHSYIHSAFYKVFKYLNINIEWFDNQDNIENINFDNCLFFTEGNVDENMPINYNSYYILHNVFNKNKYEKLINEKRVIIIQKFENVVRDNNFLIFNNLNLHYYQNNNIVLSLPWATDLLPHEIEKNINNFSLKNLKKEAYFIGSKWEDKSCKTISNINELDQFEKICIENNINFKLKSNISFDENLTLISNSLYNISIQMEWQVKHGYIPCRIFKNISYGSIPITNNFEVYRLFKKKPLYIKDINNIIKDVDNYLENKDDEYFKDIMRDVKDNHTYLNRISSYLDFLNFININNINEPNIDWSYNSNACSPTSYTTCNCGRVNNI